MNDSQNPSQPASPAPPAPSASPPPSVISKKGRIFFVEDDLPMVKMYATRFQLENYEIGVAHDGEEALTKIKEFKPDLVLLDLMIPKIGGMEVLEKLRQDQVTKNLPVIILSNLSQESDINRAAELGVKEFMIKSNFTPTEIVEAVKKHLPA